jgi:hypothetical protein
MVIRHGWIPIPIEPDGAVARIDLPASIGDRT